MLARGGPLAGRLVTAAAERARARCAELHAAAAALAGRPAREIVAALAEACARWADPAEPRRAAAEADYARRVGVPRAAAARVLDAAFGAWD